MVIWLVVEIALPEIMEAMSKPDQVEAILSFVGLLCREDSKWLGYEGIHYPQISSHTGMDCLGIIFLVEFCCDPPPKHSQIQPITLPKPATSIQNIKLAWETFKARFGGCFMLDCSTRCRYNAFKTAYQ